jgi:hypothetical protein
VKNSLTQVRSVSHREEKSPASISLKETVKTLTNVPGREMYQARHTQTSGQCALLQKAEKCLWIETTRREFYPEFLHITVYLVYLSIFFHRKMKR